MFYKNKIIKLEKELEELHRDLFGNNILGEKEGMLISLIEEIRALEKYLGVEFKQNKEIVKKQGK